MTTSQTHQPHHVHDVLKSEVNPLTYMFEPKTVAVIGASETTGSVGRSILQNLITQPFGGTVYPVNLKRHSVLNIRAYPRIGDVPEQVDLAVIATPAASVPSVISECVEAGVHGAVVISAGFKEVGEEGVELERQVVQEARRGKMRIIGPNCLGIMRPITGFNATFAHKIARPGKVALVSQSGALCTAILDWSLQANFGFSAFVSVGSMSDVGWGDLIDYLGDDPHTSSIVLYMESVGNVRKFLSAAREVALTKPIIMIKAGRTEAAAKAAASHTGALVGSDAVLDAACRRVGILRVNDIDDLFEITQVLATQPRPQGPRLAIITNAGGPGVIATDALVRNGGQIATLSADTLAEYNKVLPPFWSKGNPIDILGDASPERYAKTLEIAANDPSTDGMLVVLTPQAMTDPTRTADHLRGMSNKLRNKPVLASWMGGAEVQAGREILNQAGIPTLSYPDDSARMFCYMWQYTYALRSLYETPVLAEDDDTRQHRREAGHVISKARASGRTLLTEVESKAILAAYDIPVVDTRVATAEDQAAALAEQIGYPAVLKIYSTTITHKTDVGGVRLNLAGEAEVREAFNQIKSAVTELAGAESFEGVTVQPMVKLEGYELLLGSSIDAQFGPVMAFGLGGQLVEVFKDTALALPPLTTTLARRMMERTKIYSALKGVRGRKAVDIQALETILVRFSQLVVEQRWIKEIDINPLVAGGDGIISLDARVVLHDPSAKEMDLPQPAIRPYPTQYASPWTARNGSDTGIVIRPIRPEDEPMMVQFHQTLSERSVYMRFLNMINLDARVAHDRLRRRCFIDYDREMALVAEQREPQTHDRRIIGVGRLSRISGTHEAEFAILISDAFQHHGIGTELLKRLVEIGRHEGVRRIVADILPENTVMLRICERVGFNLTRRPDGGAVHANLDLSQQQSAEA